MMQEILKKVTVFTLNKKKQPYRILISKTIHQHLNKNRPKIWYSIQ